MSVCLVVAGLLPNGQSNGLKQDAGAKLLTVLLGILIFVDDYFNALAVGQIARPITDRHRISRAKLAYLIDSTSAPICVVSPISSWGAFIIGQLALIFGTSAVIGYSPLISVSDDGADEFLRHRNIGNGIFLCLDEY